MIRRLPRFVSAYADRHGKTRYRFRRKGQKPHSFKSRPGSPDFLTEYQACLAGLEAPALSVGSDKVIEGTFNDLIARYYRSTLWVTPRESSKATYRGIIERFRAEHGHRQVAEMRFVHADALLASKASTPAAANNLRKLLIRLMDFAVKIEMAPRNPVRQTTPFKTNKEGLHTWTEEEIDQFQSFHPLGTKARLALALLLHTGQRRSDVVRMGRQHIKDGRISVRQQKTGAKLIIPVHSELALAIRTMPPHNHLTFLVTAFGKPFTPAGFGNWFRDRCNEAGLPQCSAHGLRKAISRRMAELGLSHSQGKAVTGHVTDKEFSRYTREANQGMLADQAMANLETGLAKKSLKSLKTHSNE